METAEGRLAELFKKTDKPRRANYPDLLTQDAKHNCSIQGFKNSMQCKYFLLVVLGRSTLHFYCM